MKAIKLGVYALSGLIASNTVSTLAMEFEAIRWIVVLAVCLWLWSLTNHGHTFYMKVFRLDDAEMGTLRIYLLGAFVIGILINQGFQGGING